MMKLKIAGGCGEHGRNCFYVELDDYAFLVDCGIMADEKDGGYPYLSLDEIKNIRYIFLTHSHLDHVGALPWLISNGFKGSVIASKETIKQLSFHLESTISLEELESLADLKVEYGRSGHCIGSVWYLFEYKNKKIFFSGDYSEDTLCFRVDKIRDISADIAVLDSAYGYDENDYQYYYHNIVVKTNELLKKCSTLLFPIPKYGRGIELYALLKKEIPGLKYAGDQHFVDQLSLIEDDMFWLKEESKEYLSKVNLYQEEVKANIVFVSNPQLKTVETQRIAGEIMKNNFALMTGTVEKDTMSYELLNQGKMIMCRYPVHLSYRQFCNLISLNSFKKVIAYHSPQIKPECIEYIV